MTSRDDILTETKEAVKICKSKNSTLCNPPYEVFEGTLCAWPGYPAEAGLRFWTPIKAYFLINYQGSSDVLTVHILKNI